MVPNPPGTVEQAQAQGPAVFDASVVLERRFISRGRWSTPQWDAVAVVIAESGATRSGSSAPVQTACKTPSKTVVTDDAERRQCLWTGLRVELYKDACEGYWYNLLSEQPRLFITCFHDDAAPEDDPWPVIVTANQDEASAHLESDDWVFSVPMPEQAHRWVEQFVVNNYRPEIKSKRKRRDWTAEARSGLERRRTPGRDG
ncbi:MAG: DUF3305 domain-containing protein [Gammaproteobacteria bacterium]